MPAKSAAQQKAAGAALSAKRGDTPKSGLKDASKQMLESITEAELRDLAHTRPKGRRSTSSPDPSRQQGRIDVW
jgi:hypothetical protein